MKAGESDGTYQILENANNKGKLWFGMEYLAPENVPDIVKASVQFDSAGDFVELGLDNAGKNGFYNYIKVYDSSTDNKIRPVERETAEIKWLAADDTVLAVTKADVKVVVNTPVKGLPPPVAARRGNVGIVEAMADFMQKYGKTRQSRPFVDQDMHIVRDVHRHAGADVKCREIFIVDLYPA